MVELHAPIRFQFHKGSINTRYADYKTSIDTVFQFHKGSINTSMRNVVACVAAACFNSIKVRLILTTSLYHPQIVLFQFHKGSINTDLFTGVMPSPQ